MSEGRRIFVWRCPECGDVRRDEGREQYFCHDESHFPPRHTPVEMDRLEVVPTAIARRFDEIIEATKDWRYSDKLLGIMFRHALTQDSASPEIRRDHD